MMQNKGSFVTLPLECILRIMSFAKMLGKVDSLCKYYRSLCLSKRLLYEYAFTWHFATLPKSVADLRCIVDWGDKCTMNDVIREVHDIIIPPDTGDLRLLKACQNRRNHMVSVFKECCHGHTLRIHRRLLREDYIETHDRASLFPAPTHPGVYANSRVRVVCRLVFHRDRLDLPLLTRALIY